MVKVFRSFPLFPFLLQALIAWCVVVGCHGLSLAQTPPGPGSLLLVETVAEQVYERLPDLPKGNDYRLKETGAIAEDNTFISRVIRYHRDVKRRPTRYRFDWRLTLADYFNLNEPIDSNRYPGAASLQTNPLEGDRQLVNTLNRQQRQALVDLLAEIYRPVVTPVEGNPTDPLPQDRPVSPPVVQPTQPTLSKPGDAQLLAP